MTSLFCLTMPFGEKDDFLVGRGMFISWRADRRDCLLEGQSCAVPGGADTDGWSLFPKAEHLDGTVENFGRMTSPCRPGLFQLYLRCRVGSRRETRYMPVFEGGEI